MEANKTRRQILKEGRDRQTSNDAAIAAAALVAEARAYMDATEAPEAPQALAITPTVGARVLVSYGGPTIELVLETTRDQGGRIETTGRVEYVDQGRAVQVHSLDEDDAEDLWEAYGLEDLAGKDLLEVRS